VWVWRLTKASRPSFEGEGARLYGGRWNHPGVSLVYSAGSLSLAVLEFFVHLDPADPPRLVALGAEVPDELRIERLEEAVLPAGWRRTPAPARLADLGSAWARGGTSPVLAVPSAIVPQERNYLLNPAHADFGRITVGQPQPFALDPRMRRGR
jgi:RES domain-containing protein